MSEANAKFIHDLVMEREELKRQVAALQYKLVELDHSMEQHDWPKMNGVSPEVVDRDLVVGQYKLRRIKASFSFADLAGDHFGRYQSLAQAIGSEVLRSRVLEQWQDSAFGGVSLQMWALPCINQDHEFPTRMSAVDRLFPR